MVYFLQLFSECGWGLRNPSGGYRGQIILIMLRRCHLLAPISFCHECVVGSPRATMTWSLSGLNAKGDTRIQLSSIKADIRDLQKRKATPLFSLNLKKYSFHYKCYLYLHVTSLFYTN